MNAQVKARLAAAGFVETNVQELFGLTSEENELIETRIVLSRLIKQLRQAAHVTQADVAKRIGSDQARIAKAEKNDPSVSIELMFRVAYALGAKRKQVAHALSA
jgi:DNA-binding XRE family transcriptional regulator